MLGDLSGVSKIFVITGRTDMRKSFDGLMAIIRDTYELDPYANAVYLFCGRDSFPSISLKQSKAQAEKKISDPLCKTENFKFSISVTAGSRQTLIHCFLFSF